MGIEGKLSTMQMSDVLQWLSVSQKTGTLTVDHPEGRYRLFFQEGTLIYVRDPRNPDSLLRLFTKMQLIDTEQLKHIRTLMRYSNCSMEKIITDLKLIDGDKLEKVVKKYMARSVFELFTNSHGNFKFHEKNSEFDGIFKRPTSIENLIMETSVKIDEWERIREAIPHEGLVFRVTHKGLEYEKRVNGRRSSMLLRQMKEDKSVAELIELPGFDEFEIYNLLYRMLDKDLVSIAGERLEEKAHSKIQKLLHQSAIYKAEKNYSRASEVLKDALELSPENQELKRECNELNRLIQNEIVKKLREDDRVPVLRIPPEDPSFPKIKLTAQEGFLVSRIDGKLNLKELVKVSGMSRENALGALYKLLSEGIIELRNSGRKNSGSANKNGRR